MTGLVMAVAAATALAVSDYPAGTWVYYHFDGTGFVAGQPPAGGPFIGIRKHALPVILSQPSPIEVSSLPAGKGAVAGVCYIQSSGGRLADGRNYLPAPLMPLPVSSGGKLVATIQTDDQGHFVAALDAGVYRIGTPPLTAEVEIERGMTTLVPLRVGKRMVD